jgi:hypothetical protein
MTTLKDAFAGSETTALAHGYAEAVAHLSSLDTPVPVVLHHGQIVGLLAALAAQHERWGSQQRRREGRRRPAPRRPSNQGPSRHSRAPPMSAQRSRRAVVYSSARREGQANGTYIVHR